MASISAETGGSSSAGTGAEAGAPSHHESHRLDKGLGWTMIGMFIATAAFIALVFILICAYQIHKKRQNKRAYVEKQGTALAGWAGGSAPTYTTEV